MVDTLKKKEQMRGLASDLKENQGYQEMNIRQNQNRDGYTTDEYPTDVLEGTLQEAQDLVRKHKATKANVVK